jgi:hypothetical protein
MKKECTVELSEACPEYWLLHRLWERIVGARVGGEQ